MDRVTLPANEVVGRHVYYRGSAFETAGGVETAIAPDKTPLLAGQTATFSNYTSYDRGLNGLVIDLDGSAAALTAADFEFRRGNASDIASWTAAEPPESIQTLPGGAPGGGTRVVLGWSNAAAVRDGWLEVTVRANARTGLGVSDVVYFGNAVGESGNSVADALVDLDDAFDVRTQGQPPVDVSNRYDYNRDGLVDDADEAIAMARQNVLGADFNADDRVGLVDLSRIQQRFGQEVFTARDGDVDGDRRVTARDLAILSLSFGETVPPPMVEGRLQLISVPVSSPPAAVVGNVVADRAMIRPGIVLRAGRSARVVEEIQEGALDDGARSLAAPPMRASRAPRYTNRRSIE